VKQAALELGIPVIESDTIDARVKDTVRSFSPDILAVVAFSRIFRKSFLDIFPLGGVNLHPSLLPRYRGPSPVYSAILGGDAETGVSIQRIALEVDSGAILAQKSIRLDGSETTGSLSRTLGVMGSELFLDVLERIRTGSVEEKAQNAADVTHCRMVRKDDGRIDWSEAAVIIERKVRAYDPWPRAFTSWKGVGLLVLKSKVYTGNLGAIPGLEDLSGSSAGRVIGADPGEGILVKTGDGILAVERLQLQTKKALDWRTFLNGNRGVPGSAFGG
jgi:methionyl-tRNA formyltransferase